MLKDDAEIRGDITHFQVRMDIVPTKRKRWNRNLLIYYPHKNQESWL